MAGGLDMLMVSPAQEAALTPAVSAAYQAGIPVVCIDRGITSNDFSCYVHADNYAIGGMVADWVAEKLTRRSSRSMMSIFSPDARWTRRQLYPEAQHVSAPVARIAESRIFLIYRYWL